MSYVAIYREFRPQRFEDVIGQDHIIETIKRQVETGRVAHAYLFSGGRGSGKTSTAKILSRVVNCMHPVNGEPCNECEVCKSALEGTLTDITEIDAASNNGVDNIRDIREEVEYVPTFAKYRVYIIDEVHMLSAGAFNALLKTLEEPPKHVIFILATTEPQKLPVTILSRCQRFDFKRISIADISMALRKCATKLNLEIEDGAINLIARKSEGAMRDAYSILDRCVADGDTKITAEKARELIGIPKFDVLSEFSKLIISADGENIITFMENIISDGRNLDVFLAETIKFLRDILVYKTTKIEENLSEEEIKVIQDLASSTTAKKLIDIISKLWKVQSDMKWSSDTDVAFEAGILSAMLSEPKEVIASAPTNVASKIAIDMPDAKTYKSKVLTKLREIGKNSLSLIFEGCEIYIGEASITNIEFPSNLSDANKGRVNNEDGKIAIKTAVIMASGDNNMKIKYIFK